MQGIAKQRGKRLVTGACRVVLTHGTAKHRIEINGIGSQGNAVQSSATHRTAKQSKAAYPLATEGSPICFHPLDRHDWRRFIKETAMAIRHASVKITGIAPMLQNNPQTVDPFNRYAKAKKAITNKRAKTDDDLLELGNIETESKIYFDDKIGVYVPATWLTEAIIVSAFSIAKIGRAKMRGGLFATKPKIKLHYKGMEKVKTITDIVMNPDFRQRMLLKQGQVRVPKDAPIYHDWHFETDLEYDDTVVDFSSLKKIIERAAMYGGFGDFRPTFGRATAEVTDE